MPLGLASEQLIHIGKHVGPKGIAKRASTCTMKHGASISVRAKILLVTTRTPRYTQVSDDGNNRCDLRAVPMSNVGCTYRESPLPNNLH